LPDTTSGHETEWICSFNSEPTGHQGAKLCLGRNWL